MVFVRLQRSASTAVALIKYANNVAAELLHTANKSPSLSFPTTAVALKTSVAWTLKQTQPTHVRIREIEGLRHVLQPRNVLLTQ